MYPRKCLLDCDHEKEIDDEDCREKQVSGGRLGHQPDSWHFTAVRLSIPAGIPEDRSALSRLQEGDADNAAGKSDLYDLRVPGV